MRIGMKTPGNRVARFVSTVCGLVALGFLAPLHAETVRIDPNGQIFPPGGTNTIDIYVDGANDLQGFNLFLTIGFSSRLTINPFDPNDFVIDPNMLARWQGLTQQTFDYDPGTGELNWFAYAGNRAPGIGPSGTVRIGTLRFHGGTTGPGNFTWNEAITRLSSGGVNDNVIPATINNTYQVGAANSDLTITCNQTEPADPNTFEDGQTVTMECTVSNAGPGLSVNTQAVAVFSSDTVVGTGDAIIATEPVGQLNATASASVIISGSPNFSIEGPRQICVKVDADPSALGSNGFVLETNESNNTICNPVEVLHASRDLTLDPNSVVVTPAAVDPNAVHANSLFQIDYTIRNAGTAIVRLAHRDVVRLSTDPNIDASDPNICEYLESAPLAAGDSVHRAYGLDPTATLQKCKIPFGTAPGPYWIGVDLDVNFNVAEDDASGNSLDGNNTQSTPVQIAAPFDAEIRAHDPNVISGINVRLDQSPGKQEAQISVIAVSDIASYNVTLHWSDPNLIVIQDPNDVAFTSFLEQNGRTQSCGVTSIDNSAGSVTLGCTTSGSAAGATNEASATLFSIFFDTLAPGTGTLSFTGVTATDSTGAAKTLAFNTSTYTVSGQPDLELQNVSSALNGYPGTPFVVEFDLCNVGFGPSVVGERTYVRLSQDGTLDIDPNNPPTDPNICVYTEPAAIPARAPCVPHSVTCILGPDAVPGNYNLIVAVDPNEPEVLPFPLDTRVFALRKKGDRRMIESTGDPNAVAGTVGPLLASDTKFRPKSIASVSSIPRNLTFLAGYVNPSGGGQKVVLYRSPKYVGEDLDPNALNELRLPKDAHAMLGAADLDGDGNEELIILKRTKAGDSLDFRTIDFNKRKPVIGTTLALTEILTGTISGAAGVQFDGDPEDEIAVVEDVGGTQTLTIYDISYPAPPQPPALPPPGTLTVLADDQTFGGGGADAVTAVCSLDIDLDGTDEIAALTQDASGAQALRVYSLPATVGGDVGPPLADDPAFGGTQAKPAVISITCTK